MSFDLTLSSSRAEFLPEATKQTWPASAGKDPRLTTETTAQQMETMCSHPALRKRKAIFSSITCPYFYLQELSGPLGLSIIGSEFCNEQLTAQDQFRGAAREPRPETADLGTARRLTRPPIHFLPYTYGIGRENLRPEPRPQTPVRSTW